MSNRSVFGCHSLPDLGNQVVNATKPPFVTLATYMADLLWFRGLDLFAAESSSVAGDTMARNKYGSHMKILIHEQYVDVGAIIQEMLAAIGHEVVLLTSPDEVLTMLSKERFDILFTSQVKPGINTGVSLPWMARTVQPRIGVILMCSGKYVPGDRVPVDAALEKPFSIDQAKAVIKAAYAER